MATYYARKAGNINASDVWSTVPSGLPGAAAVTFADGDVLVANSFTITVNVSVDLGSTGQLRNDTTGGAIAGGTFQLQANGATVKANVFSGSTGSGCISSTSSATASLIGSFTAGSGNSSPAVNFSGASLTVSGDSFGGSNVAANGITNSGGGTVTITGNATGGTATQAVGIGNTGAGSITITGTATGGTNSTAHGAAASAGTITVIGVAVGATGSGASASGTGTIAVTRAKGGPTAASSAGVTCTAGNVATVEEIEYGDLGASPTAGPIRLVDKTSNVAVFYRFGLPKKTLVDPLSTANYPATSDVRSGTSYAAGSRTGTLAVPSPSLVAAGEQTDNTVGTAAITAAAIQSAVDAALTAFSGGRLASVATVASTGQQIADAAP